MRNCGIKWPNSLHSSLLYVQWLAKSSRPLYLEAVREESRARAGTPCDDYGLYGMDADSIQPAVDTGLLTVWRRAQDVADAVREDSDARDDDDVAYITHDDRPNILSSASGRHVVCRPHYRRGMITRDLVLL